MFDNINQEERFSNLAMGLVNASSIDASADKFEEGILKIATAENLNSAQIRRLSEATNQALFAVMLANDTKKFDKTAAFPIVDPQAIINKYYNEPDSSLKKVAEELPDNLSSYYIADYVSSPETHKLNLEKTASELPTSRKQEHFTGKHETGLDPEKSYYEKLAFANKVKNEIKYAVQSEKIKLAECYDALASLMMLSHGPDYKTFEKKAYLLHGQESLPFLNALRTQLALPSITGFNTENLEKIGAIIIDDTDEELVLFKQAMQAAKNYRKLENKHAELVKILGGY